jgi:hypothetical protein
MRNVIRLSENRRIVEWFEFEGSGGRQEGTDRGCGVLDFRSSKSESTTVGDRWGFGVETAGSGQRSAKTDVTTRVDVDERGQIQKLFEIEIFECESSIFEVYERLNW